MQMERVIDAAGKIDYDAIKAQAAGLREQAIEAFWSELGQRVEMLFARLRRSGAKLGASAIPHPGR
jgi:hypothetical protein